MPTRAHAEDGFGLIELLAAMVVLSIALLALLAGYGSAVVSLRASDHTTTASELANAQLELYSALPYASIGLDANTVAAIGDDTGGSYDALYSTNAILAGLIDPVTLIQAPSGPVNDVVITSCASVSSTAACAPIQLVTGADHHLYRIETFIRDLQNPDATTGISWTERIVTVVVRDAASSGYPEIVQISSAFDRGA